MSGDTLSSAVKELTQLWEAIFTQQHGLEQVGPVDLAETQHEKTTICSQGFELH